MNSLLQGTYKIPKKAFSSAIFPYLKLLVFFLASAWLIWYLKESNISQIWELLTFKVFSGSLLLAFPFTLILLNYYLEALKWQYLVSRFQPFPFVQAASGVLAGMAASFATPGSIGDYFGRILHASPGARAKLPATLFLCRICQMAVTSILGISSMGVLLAFGLFQDSLILPAVLTGVSLVLIFSALVMRKMIVRWLLNCRFQIGIGKLVGVAADFTGGEILRVLFLSLLRHLVYLFQLVLLLAVFNVNADWFLLFAGANFIFLCKSFFPVFFELGAREYGAVLFFSLCGVPAEPAVLACLVLWFFNIVIPAFAGLPFLLTLKASRK